jgi:hypothetical protein
MIKDFVVVAVRTLHLVGASMLLAMMTWRAIDDRPPTTAFTHILWTAFACIVVSGFAKVFLIYPAKKLIRPTFVPYYMIGVHAKGLATLFLAVLFAVELMEGWEMLAVVILIILHVLSAYLLSMRGTYKSDETNPIQSYEMQQDVA